MKSAETMMVAIVAGALVWLGLSSSGGAGVGAEDDGERRRTRRMQDYITDDGPVEHKPARRARLQEQQVPAEPTPSAGPPSGKAADPAQTDVESKVKPMEPLHDDDDTWPAFI